MRNTTVIKDMKRKREREKIQQECCNENKRERKIYREVKVWGMKFLVRLAESSTTLGII